MSEGLEKLGPGQARPARRRHRWSEAEKRRIVAESYQPGVSVSIVARRNDVNANMVFTWRRQYRERGGLVPVIVEPDRMLPPPPDAGAAAGRMEIALADGSVRRSTFDRLARNRTCPRRRPRDRGRSGTHRHG